MTHISHSTKLHTMFGWIKRPKLGPPPIFVDHVISDHNKLDPPTTEESQRIKEEALCALGEGYSRMKEYLCEEMTQDNIPMMRELSDFLTLNRPEK